MKKSTLILVSILIMVSAFILYSNYYKANESESSWTIICIIFFVGIAAALINYCREYFKERSGGGK